MKIENQVCTLEQAKELNELQIDFGSLLYHMDGKVLNMGYGDDYYPAFSCAELGMMLLVEDDLHFTQTHYNEHLGGWETLVLKRPEDEDKVDWDNIYTGEGDTEAEAKCDALIWMIKNNITNKENIAESLQG